MFFFGFGCGLPFFLVGQTASIWLRDAGTTLGTIGLISIANWFYVLKFLWAPLLDAQDPPLFARLGRRRGWLLTAHMVLVGALVATALTGPQTSLLGFTALLGLVAFAGATQDTAVDAYRIEIAPVQAQGALVATYSIGYRMGLITGGAGALYVAEFSSWSNAYLAMALLVLIPATAAMLAREPERSAASLARTRMRLADFVDPFREFVRRHGKLLAVVVLVFVGLYKLPDQILGVLAGPFYRDIGFTKADIATVSKLYGVMLGLAGVLAAALAIAAFPLRKLLLVAALGIATTNLLYIVMAVNPGEYWAFVLTISGDNFALGFAGTVLVTYMSSLTSAGYTATQYALLSSLANLPGKAAALFSGFIVENYGYIAFFVASTLSIVPTLLLLWWLWRRIEPAPAKA
ncbi:MAG TPA: MFS transporter [Candidatus Saccharimonadia bacterium]|nr:MFS transporter [Candidatus Saccharimonadia bacterium]